MKDTQRFTHSSWSGLHVCVWVLAIVTVLQNFEWKPEENNGVNESIYTVTPKDLEKEKEAMKERGREGQKAGTGEGESQSRQTDAKIHTAHTNSFSAIAQPVQCPPDHPKHTHKHWSSAINEWLSYFSLWISLLSGWKQSCFLHSCLSTVKSQVKQYSDVANHIRLG